MAARCWDLAALDEEYAEFLATWEPKVEAWQRRQPEGADALVERTRFIHEYRMFPFKDPGLPAELLPPGWRGRQAHDLFLAGFGLLRAPAVAHYQQVLAGDGRAGRRQPNVCGAPPQPSSVTVSGPSDCHVELGVAGHLGPGDVDRRARRCSWP